LNCVFTFWSMVFLREYHPYYEGGDGYADISYKSEYTEKAVIIEIKVASVGSDLIPLSENAINQVENKDYAFPFLQNSMTQSIFAYGIAFSGKNCLVACKKLK
uniref:PD-(D/E)XK nuclease domain-containing protein n=1 Tax=Succinivibrio sp. TaxID=2053619 RepID=UPI003FF05087